MTMPQQQVRIRPATQDDLPAILALYIEVEAAPDAAVLDVAQAQEIFQRFGRYPNYTLYVATAGESVIGTLALLIMDNLAHLGAPSGVAEDVVVQAAWQGQGVGTQMMEFAMEQCRRAGCYRLALSNNVRRTRAHQFYENLGFERHGYSFVVSLAPGGAGS